jgi:hypothetical protein
MASVPSRRGTAFKRTRPRVVDVAQDSRLAECCTDTETLTTPFLEGGEDVADVTALVIIVILAAIVLAAARGLERL